MSVDESNEVVLGLKSQLSLTHKFNLPMPFLLQLSCHFDHFKMSIANRLFDFYNSSNLTKSLKNCIIRCYAENKINISSSNVNDSCTNYGVSGVSHEVILREFEKSFF